MSKKKNWKTIRLIHDWGGKGFEVLMTDPIEVAESPLNANTLIGYVTVRKNKRLAWCPLRPDLKPWLRLHPGYVDIEKLVYDIESLINIRPMHGPEEDAVETKHRKPSKSENPDYDGTVLGPTINPPFPPEL